MDGEIIGLEFLVVVVVVLSIILIYCYPKINKILHWIYMEYEEAVTPNTNTALLT